MKLKTKFENEDFRKGEVVSVRIATLEGDLMVATGTKEGNSVEFDFKTIKEFLEYFEDAPEEVESWAQEVAYIELDSGLKIADMNYYEIDENGDKRTEFTWDEAMERFKVDPNWRLPTPKELNQMVLELGYTDEGVFDGELFAKNLGEDSLKTYKEDGDSNSGSYWSSTPNGAPAARYLAFDSTDVYPQGNRLKAYSLTVRCVARKK